MSCPRLPRSPPTAGRSRSGEPASCASRRAIASRRSSAASTPWASMPTSAQTASSSAALRRWRQDRRAVPRTREAITVWQWRSPSLPSRRTGRPSSTAPMSSASPIQASSRRWTGSSRHSTGSGRPDSGGHQQRRRLGMARRAAGPSDREGPGRRPTAAGQRSRRVRTPVSSTARGLRAGARPAGRRSRQRRRAGRSARRLAGTLMRYLVLTDIHANLEALDTCLADALARTYDATLVLGDLVGYGPDPNAVVDRVLALKPVAIVRGNHDKVACGLEQAEGFNSVAKSAARWTLDMLTPEYRDWLCELPHGPILVDDVVEICHGSPFDEDAYI